MEKSEKRFPTIKASNLEGREFIIPETLDKKYSLIIIAFWRSQQAMVDSWAPHLEELESKQQDFKFYELPSISIGFSWMRPIIDGGMRAGIPSKDARERTITLYLYKKNLLENLGIKDQSEIQLFLINKRGAIYWRDVGIYTREKFNSLEKTISELQKPQIIM